MHNPVWVILCIILSGCTQSHKKAAEFNVVANDTAGRITLTDRPPNFETPLHYFKQDFTPNEVFFVRWHLAGLPTSVDTAEFRLKVNGQVNHPKSFSLHEIKTQFKPVTIIAVAACAGNARSFLDPRVPGVQWKNGGMGNASWKGARLKDILESTGIKRGAIEVVFNGLDQAPLSSTPDFIKSLPLGKAIDEDVIVAYEMNGKPLPILNGFPLKLVVPGWYATYWVGMLSEIQVSADTFHGYWMKKAYLIPKHVRNADEEPDSLSHDLEPIHKLAIRSIFVSPEPNTIIPQNIPIQIEGVAFDGGDSIVQVEVSFDGKNWQPAQLNPIISKFSWRRWKYYWTPSKPGEFTLHVKANNAIGETQPLQHWNRSGYMHNKIETLQLFVQ